MKENAPAAADPLPAGTPASLQAAQHPVEKKEVLFNKLKDEWFEEFQITDKKEEGCTIFLATHNMEEASKLCDEIYLLNEGKINRVIGHLDGEFKDFDIALLELVIELYFCGFV